MLNKELNLFEISDIIKFLRQKKIYITKNSIWKLSVTKDYEGIKYNYFIDAQVDNESNRTEKEFALYVDNTHFVINIFPRYNMGLFKDTPIEKYKDVSEQWIKYLCKQYPQKNKAILNAVTEQMNNELKKIEHKINRYNINLEVANAQKQEIINKYYKLIEMLKPNNEELTK